MTPLPLTAQAEPTAFPAPLAGTVPTPLAGTVPAPPGRRTVAYLVDAAVLLPGLLVGAVGVLAPLGSVADPRPGVRVVLVLLGLLLAVGAVGAQAWTDATRGWTAGKRAMDLRTVAARTGAPAGRVGDLVRGWYDLADGTLVIDVRDGRDPTVPVAPVPVPATSPTAEPAAGSSPAEPAEQAAATTSSVARTATAAAAAGASPLVTLPVRVPLPRAAGGTLPVLPTPRPAVEPAPAVGTPGGGAPVSGAPTVATPTTPAAPTGPAAPTDPATAPVPVAAPAPRPAAPVDRPHGPWVELALSDGRTVTVAGSALLGRDPVPRAGETPGTLVTMDDPERAVSKTHLAVGVDASGAWVVDRRSTNGTVVTLEDGQQIICVPEERVRLSEGVAVGFGGHSFAVTALAPAGGPDPR